MATISAELLPNAAAVRLTVHTLSGIKALSRRDANGINNVRTLPGVLGTTPARTVTRRNLALNPSAEIDLSGYAAGSPGTGGVVALSRRTDGAVSEVAYCRMSWTTGNTGGQPYISNGLPPDKFASVVPGKRYTASCWIRSNVARAWKMNIVVHTASSGAGWTGAGGQAVMLEPNVWTRVHATYTIPAGNYWARMLVEAVGGSLFAAGDYIDVDATLLEEAATPGDYFDGSSQGSDVAAYSWAGTPHRAESVMEVPEPIILTDYEPAHGALRYDVADQAGGVVSLDIPMFTLDTPWLFTPVIPGFSRRLARVDEVTAGTPSASNVMDRLLGRYDPIVIMRPPGTRRGTLRIYAGTYEQARIVLEPLRQATVMMLRQPDHVGLDMYFAATDSEIFHETPEGQATTWGVNLSYVELKRPEGPLAGALGWTYAELAAATARYSDQQLTYATYADMRLGKVLA